MQPLYSRIGGKRVLKHRTINYLPNAPIASAFFGAGNVEILFYKQKGQKVYANDIDINVYAAMQTVKKRKHHLIKKLENTIENINKIKDPQRVCHYINSLPIRSLSDRAVWIITSQYFCFGGKKDAVQYAVIQRKNQFKNIIKRIKAFDLSDFEFSNLDYKEFLNKHRDKFWYLDPPYYDGYREGHSSSRALYGVHFNYQEFINFVKKKKKNILIHEEDNPFIRKSFNEFRIKRISDKMPKICYQQSKIKRRPEVIITR